MVQTFFGPQEFLQKNPTGCNCIQGLSSNPQKFNHSDVPFWTDLSSEMPEKMDFNSLSLRNGNACALLISAEKIAFAKFLEKVPSGGGIKLIFLDTLWV